MDDLVTVFYPEEYKLETSACWITVGTAEEAQKIANAGYNIALEKSIKETIQLSNVVSVDTLGFKVDSIEFIGDAQNASADQYITLTGNIGSISGNIGSANVTQSGSASSISLSGNPSSSITVGGYVNSFSSTGGTASVASTGMVQTIAEGSTSNIQNDGVVIKNNGSSQVQENSTNGNVINVTNKEGIESIRTQLAQGNRNFQGETITLKNDINMNGIAFLPLSNHDRDNKTKTDTDKWFQGTFDGSGYSIIGFSTNGFSIDGLNAATNNSSARFGESAEEYEEAVYGLFGTVYSEDASHPVTIKNLNVYCDISLELDHGKKYVGDSVGGIIGFAYGNTINIENCTVTGNLVGYDGIAAFVGRSYATNLNFKNCTNYANVTGTRKTSAFCGSNSGCTIKFENCRNEGNITCLGVARDIELVCWNVTDKKPTGKVSGTPGTANKHSYYKAAVAWVSGGDTAVGKVDGLTNLGTIKVGNDTTDIPMAYN